jgi:hypothetical protein
MAKLDILKASVDVTVYIKILDSSSTIGAGLTGLAYNSSGLTCYYVRPLGSATQLTLATQTVTGAHSDGGFVEVSASNMPGIYRLDLSDAIIASGVNSVLIQLKGVTNMVPVELEIELTSYNPYDATNMGLSVFSGITSLAQWLGLIAGKQTGNSTARTELRATGGGSGTYDETTDSQEALRDRGDAAWITAIGFSTHSAADVWAVATRTLTSISDSAGVTTLLSRLSATRAGYLDNLSAGVVALEASVQSVLSKLLKYVQLIVRKDSAIATDNATEVTAINANGGSGAGAFANTTDSQEALRDRGDAAWITATGFSTHSPADVNTVLSSAHGAGLWGGAGGAGATEWDITILVSGSPVDGVEVWVTTDAAGTNMVASGVTDALGVVTFFLDPGTYYAWKQLAGYNFTNPESFTVT